MITDLSNILCNVINYLNKFDQNVKDLVLQLPKAIS